MVTIIKFPQKTTDKDYPFFKDPRKALSEPDNVIESMTSGVNGVYHFKYYSNDWDKLSDKEIIEKYNNYKLPNIKPIEIGERKSGNGYNTVDKQWFIRIIKSTAK